MKFLKLFLFYFMIVTLPSYTMAATLHSMTKEQVQKTFINKTLVSISTDNLNGKTINNTFIMYMDDKGKIYGEMSHKPKDEPQSDNGVYTLENDGTISITWNHWDKHEKLYAQFYEMKNAYLAVSSDGVFHTVFMKEAILPGKHLK